MEKNQRALGVKVTQFTAFSSLDSRRAQQIGKVFGVNSGQLRDFYVQQVVRLGDLAARQAGGDYARVTVSESMDGNLLSWSALIMQPSGRSGSIRRRAR